LGDGVRVLLRTMKKITGIAGAAGAKLRDRSRSVKLRVREIARAARSKGPPHQARLKEAYRKLLDATGRVLGQAQRFATEIRDGVKSSADRIRQAALEGPFGDAFSLSPGALSQPRGPRRRCRGSG
jgi:IS5 family transposase